LLNGLPRSFESTIQALTHQAAPLTFDQATASLITESHKREQRASQLGDEEALATSFKRGVNINHGPRPYGRGTFPGGLGNPFIPRLPFFPSTFPIRHPMTYYNCNKSGHLARNCRLLRSTPSFTENHNNPAFANAVSNFETILSEWYFDSGASGHVAGDSQIFDSYPLSYPSSSSR
jgi:hypothetical protein